MEDLQTSGSGHCKSGTNVLRTLKYTLNLPPIAHISWVTIGPITHLGVLRFSIKAIAGSSIKEFIAFSLTLALSNKTGRRVLGHGGSSKQCGKYINADQKRVRGCNSRGCSPSHVPWQQGS